MELHALPFVGDLSDLLLREMLLRPKPVVVFFENDDIKRLVEQKLYLNDKLFGKF